MHDTDAQGNEFFKCDFCREPWAENRPMVEGHRGSLICCNCLTVAYTAVWLHGIGISVGEHVNCSLCLAHHESLHWESPLHPGIYACKKCINQSGRVLQKDAESGWKLPTAARAGE